MTTRGLYRGWYQTSPGASITYFWVIAYSDRQARYFAAHHIRDTVGGVYDWGPVESAGLCYRNELTLGVYGEDGLRP